MDKGEEKEMRYILLGTLGLLLTTNLSAAPCNGNGLGGGNKCLDTQEVQNLIDQSVGNINTNISETTQKVNNLNGQVDNLNNQVVGIDGQVTNLNGQVGSINTQVGSLNTSVNGLQTHAHQTDRRLDKLEESKWFLDVGVRVAETKNMDVELYNSYDWRHQRNHAFGMKFIFKPGKSYEEKLIEKQATHIRRLEGLLHQLMEEKK